MSISSGVVGGAAASARLKKRARWHPRQPAASPRIGHQVIEDHVVKVLIDVLQQLGQANQACAKPRLNEKLAMQRLFRLSPPLHATAGQRPLTLVGSLPTLDQQHPSS